MTEFCGSTNLFVSALSVVMTTMLVLNTSTQCGANDTMSVSILNTTTNISSVCRSKECLIGQQEVDLEFQMPSEISRRVLVATVKPSQAVLNAEHAGFCMNPHCTGKRNIGYSGCKAKYDRTCFPKKK